MTNPMSQILLKVSPSVVPNHLMTDSSVAKADVWDVTKVNIYFIGVLFAALMLVTYVPIVPMGLVELFYR